MGILTMRTSCQKPHLTKNGKRIDCTFSNCVPFVVPGLSTSSSATPTPTSSSSSSQDSVSRQQIHGKSRNQKEVEVRVRGYGETRCMNRQKPKTQIKMKEVQSDLLHDLPDWLQDLRENLVDERSPTEPRRNPALDDQDTSSSFHELPMEPQAKVEPGSGKHCVRTHFPIQIAISA